MTAPALPANHTVGAHHLNAPPDLPMLADGLDTMAGVTLSHQLAPAGPAPEQLSRE